jgi:hypothetical protein
MKIKDCAIYAYLTTMPEYEAKQYIASCLFDAPAEDNLFWQVVEAKKLKARTLIDLAGLVLKELPEFELSPEAQREQGE